MTWLHRTLLLAMAMFIASPANSEAPPAGELAEQKIIIDSVRAAIDRRDYRALNKIETEFRQTRSRTVSGIWKLSLFHWRVLTELGPKDGHCDDHSVDFFQGWFAATPTEPAPYISRAAVLEDYAWCVRGSGYAQSVSEQAFEGFAAKVAEARKILLDHRTTASVDPHFYAVMERIYIDQGADKTDFRRLLDAATAREPGYHYLYFDAYLYYLPQWYGSDSEVDELARYAAARTSGIEGQGMYARFYWHALNCGCDIRHSVDWPMMKAAMRDVMARYPSDWNASNFARISCQMNDPKEAASWFAQVKKDYAQAWTDVQAMRRCESDAEMVGKFTQLGVIHSTERCPYAAIEAWPDSDVETYCRHQH